MKIERYLMVTRIKLPYKINMKLLSEKPVTRYIMTHGKENLMLEKLPLSYAQIKYVLRLVNI